jgi:predicted nucleotidyltransferase/DNA-binding HxlR family transcriptional regulator
MSTLSEILSSRARAEVFRLLFGSTTPELHHREIVRRTGLSESAVRQELKKLTRLGLVSRRDSGNRAYYSATRKHPLFAEIRGLVLKTVGLVDVLKDHLPARGIRVAFVFGSLAQGNEKPQSDIDLMVIGRTTLRKLVSRMRGVSDELGRELSPHVMTEAEYTQRRLSGDHFVTHVLKGPRLFVVGTEDDVEAMGEQRLVES